MGTYSISVIIYIQLDIVAPDGHPIEQYCINTQLLFPCCEVRGGGRAPLACFPDFFLLATERI